MTWLIAEIWLLLVFAALGGGVAGWFLRGAAAPIEGPPAPTITSRDLPSAADRG